MQIAETIRFAGDINIDYIILGNSKGFGQNISNQVFNISIFEDLFAPFITGKITVSDSLDLTNIFPMVGDEFLDLSVRTPTYNLAGKIIQGRYYVYKMSEREQLNPGTYVYVLHFISVEAVVDVNKKMSRSFSGKVSDIAKTLITTSVGLNSQKDLNLDETLNGTKFTSNYWNPVKCINYATTNAQSFAGTPDYLFFENRIGFNFLSMETLYSQDVYQNFVADNYVRDSSPTGGSFVNIGESYRRVTDFSIGNGFDYINNIRSGMYGNKTISWDFVTKKYVSKNYNTLEDFNNSKHLGVFPIIAKNSISTSNGMILNVTKDNANFNGYDDVTNTKTMGRRLALFSSLDVYKITIEVRGRTDYSVGQKVGLRLYKTTQITAENDDNIDKLYSGNYIIAAIHHKITRDSHACSLELIKESLDFDINRK